MINLFREKMSLQVKLIKGKEGKLPVRESKGAAGYDLSTPIPFEIEAGGKITVPLGIIVKVLPFTYGRIAPRSGLAHKSHIDVGGGVIDKDFRGEVGVILFNHGKEKFTAKKHDRIAQLIIERIETPEVEQVEELDETERKDGAYGSTGH
jgi:dUTP pyrophosphatase